MEQDRSIHVTYSKPDTGYHRIIADKVCSLVPEGGKVVDIGCGPGNIMVLIHSKVHDFELHAVDVDSKCLEIVRNRLPQVIAHTLSESGSELENMKDKYDAVIMCHCLEHMRNPIETIERAMRLLTTGGLLFLAVPNPVRPLVFLSNIFRKHYVNRGHYYAWDKSHWINFLDLQNLNVQEHLYDEVRIFPERISKAVPVAKKIEMAVARLIPWWSYSNISIVKK